MSVSHLCARALAPILLVAGITLPLASVAEARSASEAVGFDIPDASGGSGGWIGSYRIGSRPHRLYCGDPTRHGPRRRVTYARATPVHSWRTLSGAHVPTADLQRVGWILSRYGDTSSRRRAAAVDTTVYALTASGDYRWGGRRAEQRLRATGRYAAVKRLARQMLVDSVRNAGTHSMFVRTATVTDAGDVTAVIGVRAGGGGPVAGARVAVDFEGDTRARQVVTTNRFGEAYVSFRASRPGRFRISASASGLPSSRLWVAEPHSERTQRLFVAGRPTSAHASDTVTIKTHPKVTTTVATRVATPATPIVDLVHVRGLAPGYRQVATAELFGPFVSVQAATCTVRTRVRRVAFDVRGNGWWRTQPVVVGRAGYYTWVASTPGDSHNNAARELCGRRAETTLQRRPPYQPPTVRAGFASVGASRSLRAPHPSVGPRLRIRSLRIDAPVRTVGTSGSRMRLPEDVSVVGRLAASARIDDVVGSTVMAGHVSDKHDRPGAFYRLARVRPGHAIAWIENGRSVRYVVTKVRTRSRAKPLPPGLFRTVGAHRLVLISCTGRVRTANGGFHYTRNVIVIAKPAGR